MTLFAAVAAAAGEPDEELARLRELLRAAPDSGFAYRADRYVDYAEQDSILLDGNAVVEHRGARLESAQMVYRRDRRIVVARAGVDSSGQPFGVPTLTRGDEVLKGESIVYDIESGEGLIRQGRIGHGDGFYAGQRIRTRTEEEFHVGSGSYTTCDEEEPHFDFYSPRIKVLVGDMAIARPVYFRVAERRLFWVPFYVFSLREDRQSGMLTPGFGRRPVSYGSSLTEWEVRDLGYYLAPSDYWDLTVAADLRQRSGWLARGALAYAWRYHFDGGLQTRLQSFQSGDRTSWSWWLSGNHTQDLGPGSSLRARGTFVSDRDFLRNNATRRGDRLQRTLRSNLRYQKRWRQAGWSLSAGAGRTKYLDSGRSDDVLPEISLRSNRRALFPSAGTGGRDRRGWGSRVFYDGSLRLRNTRRQGPGSRSERTLGEASLGLSSQQRPLTWLNLNGAASSRWLDQDLRGGEAEGVRSDRLRASATLSRTLYGLFHPALGPVTALRHVLKPDAGFSFSATRADSGGIGFRGRAGDWGTSRRLTLRLNNTFLVKLLQGEEELKHRLAQLNLSTSYDFDRSNRPLSPLVTSLTLDAGRRLRTRLSLDSEFYDDEDRLIRPRVRRFEVNTTLRLTATPGGPGSGPEPERGGAYGPSSGGSGYEGGSYGTYRAGGGFGYDSGLQQDIRRGPGRRLQVGHYYSRQRRAGAADFESSRLQASIGGRLFGGWHLDYSVYYNLKDPGVAFLDAGRITAELLSLQRSFHDWTATLNIEPSGFAQSRAFYFKAQLKDIPQIRFERGDRRSRRIG